MKKITIKISNTLAETFEDFIISRKAKGLSDKTLTTYNQHFKAIQRQIDVDIPKLKQKILSKDRIFVLQINVS